MNDQPLVSIITVVRNDAEHLSRTMQSVSQFKSARVEYIVVDGASTDDTLLVAASRRDMIDILVSEPDKGIYDAMNKGIALAHGKYLLFLNAGDELLAPPDDIVSAAPEKSVIVYAKARMFNPDGSFDYIKGKRLKNISRFLQGMPLCHQAVFYRRELIGEYDLRFKVISDRVKTYNLLRKYGRRRAFFVDSIMVNYYQDGFCCNGVTDAFLAEEDALFYRSVGKSYYITIKKINYQFKHKIKRPILRLFGRKF